MPKRTLKTLDFNDTSDLISLTLLEDKMNRFRAKHLLIFALIAGLIMVTGCASDEEKTDKLLVESQAYFDNGEYNKAIIQVQNAIKLTPNSVKGYELLAKIQLKLGKANEAFNAYLALEELAPDDLKAKIQVAYFFLLKKDIPSAEQRVNQVLEKEPENIDALYVHGSIQAAKKLPLQTILATYHKILKIDPKQARAHLIMARHYGQTGDQEKVEFHLKTALELQPDNKNYYKSLSAYYVYQKRYTDAGNVLEQMKQHFPKDTEPYILLSNFYSVQNQPQKAADELKKAIELEPENIKTLMIYAKLLAFQKRFDEAETYFQKAIELEPDNVAIQGTLAEYYFSNKQFEKAKAMVDQILSKRPDYMAAKILQGQLLMTDKKIDAAIDLFLTLVKEEPNSIAINYLLASCYFEKNQLNQAQTYLNKALERNPRLFRARLMLADIQYRTGNLEMANANIQKVLALNPDHYNGNVIFGNIAIAKKNYGDAKIIFNDLVRQEPDNPTAYFRLGVAYRLEKEFNPAIKNLKKALELNPRLMDVFINLVSVYAEMDDYNTAITLCDTHLEKVRTEPVIAAIVLNSKGTLLTESRQVEKGKQVLRKAIETNRNYITPYMTLGKVLAREGKKDEAAQIYLELLKHRPNLPAPHSFIASIYEGQGKLDEAETHYKKALEIFPDYVPAMNNLAFLYAEQGKELNRALDLARRAKEIASYAAPIIDTLGWVYMKKELYDSAIEEFKTCIQINPRNPVFHYHLGLAYFKTGKKDLAKKSFEESLSIQSDYNGSDDAKEILKQL